LQAFYGIRSERLLLEQLQYNLLFSWFVGLGPDDPIWHGTTNTISERNFRVCSALGCGELIIREAELLAAPEPSPGKRLHVYFCAVGLGFPKST
jgi:hypothetical protein